MLNIYLWLYLFWDGGGSIYNVLWSICPSVISKRQAGVARPAATVGNSREDIYCMAIDHSEPCICIARHWPTCCMQQQLSLPPPLPSPHTDSFPGSVAIVARCSAYIWMDGWMHCIAFKFSAGALLLLALLQAAYICMLACSLWIGMRDHSEKAGRLDPFELICSFLIKCVIELCRYDVMDRWNGDTLIKWG